MHRYIEMKDKDGQPIFEGDEFILTIKDKDFGNSHMGNFCKFFDIDTIKVQVLSNGKKLQVKYKISFFKDNIQVVTRQEEKYWAYTDDCKDDGKPVEKELGDFRDVKNAKEFYESDNGDSLFFSYLCNKGLEKTSGIAIEAVIIPDESLEIPVESNQIIHINDKITFKLTKELREKFSNYIPENELLIVDEFTNITFNFKRIEGRFNYDIETTFTDNDGKCLVMSSKLNDEAEKAYLEYERKESRIRRQIRANKTEELKKEELEKERIELDNKMEALYNDKNNLIYYNFTPFFGFNQEINVFNYLVRENMEQKVLN